MLKRLAKDHTSLILFVLPAFILYVTFLVIPMLQGSYYSFTNWDGLNKHYSFVGIENFIEAIRDDANFRSSILLQPNMFCLLLFFRTPSHCCLR